MKSSPTTTRYRLRSINQVPPGGKFTIVDPDTGKIITATNFYRLVELSKDHRYGNGLPVPADWAAQVNHLAAQFLIAYGHGEWCENADKPFLPVALKMRIKLADVMRGTMTIGTNVLAGNPRVPPEEADRRAAICVSCIFNVDVEDCISCRVAKAIEAIRSLVGSASTRHDDNLRSCYWCGCFNRAQVHFPLDRLQRFLGPDLNDKLPDQCWKKTAT